MHPCNKFKNLNQLESDTFHSSVCADNQTTQLESDTFHSSVCADNQTSLVSTPRTIRLAELIMDISVYDGLKKFDKTQYKRDEYWDDHFYIKDDFLLPLSRFSIVQVVEDALLPPIEIYKDGSRYTYNNGRHRHLRLLLRNQCDPNFKLVEGVHFVEVFRDETRVEEVLYKFVRKVGTNLFFLDSNRKCLRELHKKDFERRDSPCVRYKEWVVKYNCERKQARGIIIKLYHGVYHPEVLEELYVTAKKKFVDFLEGISTIFEVIAGVGRVSSGVKTKYEEIKAALSCPTMDKTCGLLKEYGVSLLRILLSVGRVISDTGLNMLNLSSLILDVLELLSKSGSYRAESLESVLIAGVSALIPESVAAIIKRMTLLTNKKLFDDNSFVLDFFGLLAKLLTQIISYFPDKVKDYMNSVLELFGITEFVFIHRAKRLLAQYYKDKHIILNDSFRSNIRSLKAELGELDLKRFFSKNKPLCDVANEFNRIWKAVESYEQTSRQEPSCFVFEGPPGCRKSVTVNKVIATLGLTHYSHIVKCAEDSKDWYDSYNNEEIFYMDDVGQMGKSQWRNLINWVSAVKLPLDCAEASLKDTKYFNSEIILLTTNNFINLHGFTTKDCIETPEALWRRGYVFDFSKVVGVGDFIQGVAEFKFYDIKTKQFVNGFPKDFNELLFERSIRLDPYCIVDDQATFLAWITTIIMGFKTLKQKQQSNNSLLSEDIKLIRRANPFINETKPTLYSFNGGDLDIEEADESDSSISALIMEYAQHALEVCKNLLTDALAMIFTHPLMACSALVVGLFATTMIFKYKDLFHHEGSIVTKQVKKEESDIVNDFETIDLNKGHSVLPKIANQMFEIDMICTEEGVMKSISCHSLISGRNLVVPYHLVLDREMQVVVYKDRKRNHRIIDHAPVKLKYKNVENDVAVVALSDGFPSPFPKLASCFQTFVRDKIVGLVFPGKIIKADGLLINPSQYGPIMYPVGDQMNKIKEPILYEKLHFRGMCGTVVVTAQGSILGMHVAGHDSLSMGAALQWSRKCLEDLYTVLNNTDLGLKIDVVVNEKIQEDCSGFKINTDLSVYVPKNSNFIKSPLYGVFEVSRRPANLSVYGPHTVKDVSKSSRSPIGPVVQEELNFAGRLLDLYFDEYDDLTEVEIVCGDDMLAPINKKSSNGIFPIRDKEECFDFVKGEFKSEFRVLYDAFEKKMSTGDIDVADIAWSETLKDELRNYEKKEPRSFRVSPVTMQVLTKKCFGKLVKKIVKERWFNEIMIGLNPFTEWPKLYGRMVGGRCWGGDIGKYDKNMRVQVQEMVAEKMLQYYRGNLPQAARNILLNIAFNVVVVNDDSWILTHSLPSGCWLTAIFNSLVNRVYTAMWYYREMTLNGQKPNHLQFHNHISDPVYGDDRLNRCIDSKHQNYLNAITMEKFFNSLGMEMTDSLKGKIVTPFQPVEDLTFLKRYFRFHPVLQSITCPLDLRTVYSTLSWIDSSKEDLDVVLRDKINAFQREIFLHYDIYERDIRVLEKACLDRGVPFTLLPLSYLKRLYVSGEFDDFYSKAFGVLISS